jgi:hypothetical protein
MALFSMKHNHPKAMLDASGFLVCSLQDKCEIRNAVLLQGGWAGTMVQIGPEKRGYRKLTHGPQPAFGL